MKRVVWAVELAAVGIVLPFLASAQDGGVAGQINGLQKVLDEVYNEMVPMCASLRDVARGIGGFGALWYIAARVWRHLANAESIDLYPLFRPFVIGGAIILWPSCIALINGVMQPTVTATSQMVKNSDVAVAALLKDKEDAVKNSDFWKMYVGPTGDGDRDKWYKYTHPDEDPGDEGFWASIGNDVRFAVAKASYNFRNAIKEVVSEILQILFAAASLCINTMRTFNLLILAIIGPLAFAFGIFDGLQHTLRHWLARYLNVFLWLPVANIFGALIGKIQENMLKLDLAQISQTGDTFFSSTDIAYLVFLVIGIIGYTTVPTIANHIIHVGTGDALTGKTSGVAGAVGAGAVRGAGQAASMTDGTSGGSGSWLRDALDPIRSVEGGAEGPIVRRQSGSKEYLRDRLSGK